MVREFKNIAEDLSEKELNQIGQQVFNDFKEDWESRSEWESKHEKYLKVYYQIDKSSNSPWENSSQESIPILTQSCNQFQSRSYKAFFPTRNFVSAIPIGKPTSYSTERAERIGKHMSFQLAVVDRKYKVNKNEMFLAVALHGSDFTKTYYDPIKRAPVIERVSVNDLVVPYGYGARTIDEIERKTQVIYMSENKANTLYSKGWFMEKPKATSNDDFRSLITEVEDEVEGIEESSADKNNMVIILEQHCLLDLDEDEDGIEEPYIVWVDAATKKVLRIQIRYEIDEEGNPTNDKIPIEYFTHYQFLPNPNGFYGLGFGLLLANINAAINKIARQNIDANELSTIGSMSGVMDSRLDIDGDDFDISLGRFKKVNSQGRSIRDNIFQFSFPGMQPTSFTMMQYLVETARQLASVSDVLSGQPDKVYQPLAMLTMVEQGLQLFSSIQEFLGYSMEEELQKVYNINRKYLHEEAFYIENDESIAVTGEDYMEDFRVIPIFDPKYSTREQKVAKAQAEYEFIINNPLSSQDSLSLYNASRRFLEAIDTNDIDKILPKPEETPPPENFQDPEIENGYWLMPQGQRVLFDVYENQNHTEHIQSHHQFLVYLNNKFDEETSLIIGKENVNQLEKDEFAMILEDRKIIATEVMAHIKKHQGYQYLLAMELEDEERAAQNGRQFGEQLDGISYNPQNTANIEAEIPSAEGIVEMPIGNGRTI